MEVKTEMTNEIKKQLAEEVFLACNTALSQIGCKYTSNKSELTIKIEPDECIPATEVKVYEGNQVVRVTTDALCDVKGEKMIEAALAIGFINDSLANGSFAYSFHYRKVYFVVSNGFAESVIRPDLIKHMIGTATLTADAYGKKIESLLNGEVTMEDFVKDVLG